MVQKLLTEKDNTGGHHMTDRQKEQSTRAQDHEEMLKAALARPGVREFMQVYGGWKEADRELDVYRAAMRRAGRIVTTPSSNAN